MLRFVIADGRSVEIFGIDSDWRIVNMNRWLKIFLLIVQIGGGLLGIAIVGRAFWGQDLNSVEMIMVAAFVFLFAFGILAGAALIWKPKLGMILSLIFQAIQIPVIITPVVSFILAAGVFWNVFWHETGWGTSP